MRFRPWFLFLSFLALAIALRWGSFFTSVINHDESTYIVIADELLRGDTYLRDVIDTKPIGIFLVYAALIKFTGGSIFALRLAATFFVALAAWLLAWTSWRVTATMAAAWASGIIYCVISTIYTHYGLSPNTEIFFNCFTIAAVGLVVAPRVAAQSQDHFWHWPIAGFLLGCGFVIKPFVAAEALAIGLFLVYFYFQRQQLSRLISGGLLLTGAFAIPPLLVIGYYYYLDMSDILYFYSVLVNTAYTVDLAWYLRLKYLGDYLLRYAPFVIIGAVSLVRQFNQNKLPTWGMYLALQFCLVTVVILLTGKRFGHYQIQLHPILSLMAALWWMAPSQKFSKLTSWWSGNRRKLIFVSLALLFGLIRFFNYQQKEDKTWITSRVLADQLRMGDRFVCVNGHQIIYHLLDQAVPTPYVHPSLLSFRHNTEAFEIDPLHEAQSIIDDKKMRFLVHREDKYATNRQFEKALLAAFPTCRKVIGDTQICLRAAKAGK